MATGDNTAPDPFSRTCPAQARRDPLVSAGTVQDHGPGRNSQASTSSKNVAITPGRMLRYSSRQQQSKAIIAELTCPGLSADCSLDTIRQTVLAKLKSAQDALKSAQAGAV